MTAEAKLPDWHAAEIARRSGNDLQAICEEAKKRQDRDERKIVRLAPRSVTGKPRDGSVA